MQRGRQESEDGVESIYVQFLDAILRALDECEALLVLKWKDIATKGTERKTTITTTKENGDVEVKETTEVIGSGDWRGIAELLLRRYPLNFSRKEAVELTGKDGQPIQVEGSMAFELLSVELQRQVVSELETLQIGEGVRNDTTGDTVIVPEYTVYPENVVMIPVSDE